MKKDFDSWNNVKKRIHEEKIRLFYHKREVWWCLLGTNIGLEHDGDAKEYLRPVLILQGLSAHTCFVIPLTSSKSEHQFRIPIGKIDTTEAKAVISQLRVIDTKRLVKRICFLDEEKFEITRKAIKDML